MYLVHGICGKSYCTYLHMQFFRSCSRLVSAHGGAGETTPPNCTQCCNRRTFTAYLHNIPSTKQGPPPENSFAISHPQHHKLTVLVRSWWGLKSHERTLDVRGYTQQYLGHSLTLSLSQAMPDESGARGEAHAVPLLQTENASLRYFGRVALK